MTRHLFLATQFKEVGQPEEGIEVHELALAEVEALLNRFELAEPREVYRAMRELASSTLQVSC